MTDQETMELPQGINFTGYIKQGRDKVRAKYAESTGLIAFKLPSPPPPNTSHQTLPVRENVVDTASPAYSANKVPDSNLLLSSSDGTLHMPTLKPAEYVILLPIVSMVRDIYEATVRNRRHEIQAFLSDENINPTAVAQMDAMVEELKMLTDHQDLIADLSATQVDVADEHQAKWAVTCSSKCLFLQHFFHNMRPYEKHIALLARPGRMLDTLEVLLKTNGFMYDRPDRPSSSNSRKGGPLRITLLPTGLDGGQYVVDRADAVIAFDETFRVSERYSNILRTHLYEPKKLAPLISLVVTCSAEHIELCLSKGLDPIERKIFLVDFITQLREEVGKLDPELPSPEEAAAAVAKYLASEIDNDSVWPLPPNPNITGLQSPNSGQTQRSSGSTTQTRGYQSSQAPTPQGAMKRSLGQGGVAGLDADSTKRMRMTPTLGEGSSRGDVTRVSDSVGYPSQEKPVSTGDAAHETIANKKALDDEQSRQVTSLLAKVTGLEVQLQSKENIEERLRQSVKELEQHLADQISTMKKLQPKFRRALTDRGKFLSELDAAKSQVDTLSEKIEAQVVDIAKLKEEKTGLENELTKARMALTNSTVPEAAELAKAKADVYTLLADKDRLEKRVGMMQSDFEFTRDSYQKTLSRAAELANELSEMKDENTALKRKASENTVRIAEIQRANENKEREDRIDELEALLRDRERELWKKHEELKVKTNGRRETRGTSVPRSPRMGSGAMSPRPQFARPAGGSRGASPAPGEQSREGFRDATSFPPSGLGSARWPHLT